MCYTCEGQLRHYAIMVKSESCSYSICCMHSSLVDWKIHVMNSIMGVCMDVGPWCMEAVLLSSQFLQLVHTMDLGPCSYYLTFAQVH